MPSKKASKSPDRSRSPKKEDQKKQRKRSTSRSRTAKPERASKGNTKETKSRSKSASRQSAEKKRDTSKPRNRSTSRSRKSAPAVAAAIVLDNTTSKSTNQSVANNNVKSDTSSQQEKVTVIPPQILTDPTVSRIPPTRDGDKSMCQVLACFSPRLECLCSLFGFSLPYGGPLGALVLVSILLFMPLLMFVVATHHERLTWPHVTILEMIYAFFNNYRLHYFHLPAIGWYGLFLLMQLALGLLPLGSSIQATSSTPSETKKGLTYRTTGLVRLVITASVFMALYYWRKDDLLFLRQRWRALLGSVGLVSVVVGLLMYIVSLLPVYTDAQRVESASKGFWPYKVLVGSLLHPRLPALSQGMLDIKLWSLETSLISWLVLDGLWFVAKTDRLQALTVGLFHVALVVAMLLEERPFVVTSKFTEEGYGMIQSIMSFYTLPFVMSAPVCFLTHTGSSPQWFFTLTSLFFAALFVAAFLIFCFTRLVKLDSQVDPYNPEHISIVGIDGNRTFADGPYWLIRHPQSLCQLVMLFAHSAFIGYHILPWTMFFLGAFIIFYRMYKEEKRCLSLHGKAYLCYKTMVPYMLIPYLI